MKKQILVGLTFLSGLSVNVHADASKPALPQQEISVSVTRCNEDTTPDNTNLSWLYFGSVSGKNENGELTVSERTFGQGANTMTAVTATFVDVDGVTARVELIKPASASSAHAIANNCVTSADAGRIGIEILYKKR